MGAASIKVLLVEDNPGDAVLIRDMLGESREARFELTRVDCLAAAQRALAEGSFGLVLLDLSLPDSRGLDTFRALRQTNPRMPLVVLTGLDDEAQAVQAVQDGAQDYLVKGHVAARQLAHALRYAMGRHHRHMRIEESLLATKAELAMARKIQQDLLPCDHPRLPGFDVFGASLSATAVGGDLFQYLWLPDGTLGLAIADVTGHGVGPALLMVAVRSYLRAFAQTQTDPGQIMTLVNRLFAQDVTDGNNCSLCLAKLDGPGRALAFASAGHHPPGLLLGGGGAVKARLYSTGPLLGIVPDAEFPKEGPLPLEAGDLLLLLTDGVVEAQSAEGKWFGAERALEVVRAERAKSARHVVEAIFRSVSDYRGGQPQADDITAIVIRVTG
jgi:sigma-B regulation protein RsbU (phosphoserine phosphatase)